MKNNFALITTAIFVIAALTVNAQVQVSKKIDFQGSGSNAKITGIDAVEDADDAVSAEVAQKATLVYAAASGSGGNYVVNLTPAVTTYNAGMFIFFKANHANTGAATINVNSLGAVSIKKNVNADLGASEIQNGKMVIVSYDGTNFQMMGQ